MASFLENVSGYNGIGLGEYPASVYLVRQAFYDFDRLFELVSVNIRQDILFRQQGEQLVFASAAFHLGVVHGSDQGDTFLIRQIKHFDLVEPVGVKEVEPFVLLSLLVFPGVQIHVMVLDVGQQAGGLSNDRGVCGCFQVSGREGDPCPLAVVGLTELFQVLTVDAGPDSLLRLLLALLILLLGRLRGGRVVDRQCFDLCLLLKGVLIQV